MTERIVVGSDGRKYITHEPAPQREWQGLTDEEAEQIIDEHWEDLLMLMEAIEAKLKEKNT